MITLPKPQSSQNPQLSHVLDAPFTAFPNWLVDEVMPTLRDTELRVLLVVVRQTLGWTDGKGGRKQRGWLSQKQLMARTGRNSAAVSAAIDGLVRRHLVECFDKDGEMLLTPHQRRACRGRIYYGLCRNGDKAVENSGDKGEQGPTMPKSAVGKANTTKETGNKIKSISMEEHSSRIYAGWAKAGEIAATLSGHDTPSISTPVPTSGHAR